MHYELKPKERELAKRELRRIQRLLRKGEWRIRLVDCENEQAIIDLNRGEPGEITGVAIYAKRLICIDYRAPTVARLVHECLHAINQKLPESAIRDREQKVMAIITPRQSQNLLRLAFGDAGQVVIDRRRKRKISERDEQEIRDADLLMFEQGVSSAMRSVATAQMFKIASRKR